MLHELLKTFSQEDTLTKTRAFNPLDIIEVPLGTSVITLLPKYAIYDNCMGDFQVEPEMVTIGEEAKHAFATGYLCGRYLVMACYQNPGNIIQCIAALKIQTWNPQKVFIYFFIKTSLLPSDNRYVNICHQQGIKVVGKMDLTDLLR